MKLLLVDDHQMLLDGLQALLEGQQDLIVSGTLSKPDLTLETIQLSAPDIVVMDIVMGEVNGLKLTAKIRSQFPSVKVLILSAHVDPSYVSEALKAGASAYVLKGNSADELLRAINLVSKGQQYLSPEVSAVLMSMHKSLLVEKTVSSRSALSQRETDVLKLISEGNSTREIAEKLGLSAKTVETHRARLMTKLKCYSVAELVRYALKEGISSLE